MSYYMAKVPTYLYKLRSDSEISQKLHVFYKGSIISVSDISIIEGWGAATAVICNNGLYEAVSGYVRMKYWEPLDERWRVDTNPYSDFTKSVSFTITSDSDIIVKESKPSYFDFGVSKVIFNPPATIIIWSDGRKSIAKCSPDDTWDAEKGFAYAFLKGIMPESSVAKLRKKYVKPQLEKEQEEYLLNLPEMLAEINLPKTLSEITERLKQWADGYNVGEYDDRTWNEVAKTEEEENAGSNP